MMMLTICIFWSSYPCYYIPFWVWDGLNGVSLVGGSLQKWYIQPILSYKMMVALLGMCSLPLPVSLSAISGQYLGRLKRDPHGAMGIILYTQSHQRIELASRACVTPGWGSNPAASAGWWQPITTREMPFGCSQLSIPIFLTLSYIAYQIHLLL